MRFRGQSDDQIDVRLDIDELMILKNVLHEVCNRMQFTEDEFQVIFGFNRAEIEALMLRTANVVERLRLPSE